MTTTEQLDRQLVLRVIATYQQAWESRDPERAALLQALAGHDPPP